MQNTKDVKDYLKKKEYTVQETAEIISRTVPGVMKIINSKVNPMAVRKDGRRIYVLRDSVVEYLNCHPKQKNDFLNRKTGEKLSDEDIEKLLLKTLKKYTYEEHRCFNGDCILVDDIREKMSQIEGLDSKTVDLQNEVANFIENMQRNLEISQKVEIIDRIRNSMFWINSQITKRLNDLKNEMLVLETINDAGRSILDEDKDLLHPSTFRCFQLEVEHSKLLNGTERENDLIEYDLFLRERWIERISEQQEKVIEAWREVVDEPQKLLDSLGLKTDETDVKGHFHIINPWDEIKQTIEWIEHNPDVESRYIGLCKCYIVAIIIRSQEYLASGIIPVLSENRDKEYYIDLKKKYKDRKFMAICIDQILKVFGGGV